MARLTADELDAYRRDGWVVPRFRPPAAEVDAVRAALVGGPEIPAAFRLR